VRPVPVVVRVPVVVGMSVVVIVVVDVGVLVPQLALAHDLDLLPRHRGRHGHDERAHVAPDVEQDRALPGEGVLHRCRGTHDAAVVPGSVW